MVDWEALPLAEGDVLFIALANPLYRFVAQTTGCRASHVGIAFRDNDGWQVAEGTVPVSAYTPLPKFMKRALGDWCTIRRVPGGLETEQVLALRRACDTRMGRVYHQGFRFDSQRRQFCSKLVYEAYHEALGLEVGELETFRQLLHREPSCPLWFWRLWFFGFIPWDRRTVTPASQHRSAALETVFSG